MRPTLGKQLIVGGAVLVLLLLYPLAYAQESVSPSQTGTPAALQPDIAKTAASASTQSSGNQFPDSPGTVQSRPGLPQANAEPATSQQSNSENIPAQSGTAAQAPSAQGPDNSGAPKAASDPQNPPPSQQPQSNAHEPLGTAAAESVPTTGIAASRPAGAAIAPAKQRRVRSLLIKVGVIVGAGVAAGTTMALSKGSPSKPPGAH
jgi:hypothetical protein